jgi:hypothetical protein
MATAQQLIASGFRRRLSVFGESQKRSRRRVNDCAFRVSNARGDKSHRR